jgi:hypothetical protein
LIGSSNRRNCTTGISRSKNPAPLQRQRLRI